MSSKQADPEPDQNSLIIKQRRKCRTEPLTCRRVLPCHAKKLSSGLGSLCCFRSQLRISYADLATSSPAITFKHEQLYEDYIYIYIYNMCIHIYIYTHIARGCVVQFKVLFEITVGEIVVKSPCNVRIIKQHTPLAIQFVVLINDYSWKYNQLVKLQSNPHIIRIVAAGSAKRCMDGSSGRSKLGVSSKMRIAHQARQRMRTRHADILLWPSPYICNAPKGNGIVANGSQNQTRVLRTILSREKQGF